MGLGSHPRCTVAACRFCRTSAHGSRSPCTSPGEEVFSPQSRFSSQPTCCNRRRWVPGRLDASEPEGTGGDDLPGRGGQDRRDGVRDRREDEDALGARSRTVATDAEASPARGPFDASTAARGRPRRDRATISSGERSALAVGRGCARQRRPQAARRLQTGRLTATAPAACLVRPLGRQARPNVPRPERASPLSLRACLTPRARVVRFRPPGGGPATR